MNQVLDEREVKTSLELFEEWTRDLMEGKDKPIGTDFIMREYELVRPDAPIALMFNAFIAGIMKGFKLAEDLHQHEITQANKA